jgi:hypothetical protein
MAELVRSRFKYHKEYYEYPDRAKALTVGMEVEYFCTERNYYVLCSILKVGRTRVEIREKETGKGWSLPF